MNARLNAKTIKIYVEGGGDQANLKTECRKAFSKFVEKCGLVGRMPRIIACGSRNEAYDDFCTAMRKVSDDEYVFLLVDSEAAVQVINKNNPWQHLKDRDNWNRPNNVRNEQAHLMVQCMENWFLADINCLQIFYGNGFNSNALPQNPNIEAVNKNTLFHGLENATKNTQKGAYGKGAHSFKILENLDPQNVIAASPWADRFIKELKKI